MRAEPIRRLAIYPCAPVLLPGATGREPVDEVQRLRVLAADAIDWLCADGDPVVVLCAGSGPELRNGTELSAAAYGLDYRTRLGCAEAELPIHAPRTPGPLVAAYLLGEHRADVLQVGDVAAAGQRLAELAPRAVLVCGGGSARRRDGAPGYVDERAVPYDDSLVEEIASGDLAALAAADLEEADALLCDLARPLAAAARAVLRTTPRIEARVDDYSAPYGVANIVARWWNDA